MSSTLEAFTVTCTAVLGDNPNYKGTVHDDEMARKMGYRGALVPGIRIVGYAADGIIGKWGLDWVRQGTISARSRRGVYDGDQLRTVFTPAEGDLSERTLSFSMFNADDEQVALGTVALPANPEAPPPRQDYPRNKFVVPPPRIAAGEFSVGDRFGSLEVTVTDDFFASSQEEFGQTWPRFRQDRLLSPACLQKIVSRSINTSYAYATPPIFVSTSVIHYGLIHIGDTLMTSGIIRTVYMRNGHHYYDADILVIRNGTEAVALVKRSMIYSARAAAA